MTGGWVEITGATLQTEFICKDWSMGGRSKPKFKPLPGDLRYWVDLDYRERTLNLKNAYFISNDHFITGLAILEDTNTMEVKIRRNANGDYVIMDGDQGTGLDFGYKSDSGRQQLDYAGERFKIAKISLTQAT